MTNNYPILQIVKVKLTLSKWLSMVIYMYHVAAYSLLVQIHQIPHLKRATVVGILRKIQNTGF